jgi:histidinol-phosphate phosphatase family protein
MLVSSVLIPFAAIWHRVAGTLRHRAAGPWRRPVRAVLFDRDGTLVHDVPYNGDPSQVRTVDGAAEALNRLRDNGIRLGVVTNQSGVARGLLSMEAVDRVNDHVDALLGPFDTWQVCPHGPDDGCRCRKPQPGLVTAASRELGLDASEVVVVGDIGADVSAAERAGSRGVIVPTAVTKPAERSAARWRAATPDQAVELLLAGLR